MTFTVGLPNSLPLPDEEQPATYQELVKERDCSCFAGAIISPSGLLPSATINIGDALADITSHLANFTNAYSIILVVIKMIGCIIEVLCAIPNPFSTIAAMIRLFGTCLPEFILIFPFFAIPSIILCIIKIILAMIEYVVTVIIPIITDIVQNVTDLKNAFESTNEDAQEAIVFKLVALVKELYNIIGIFVALSSLISMIEALINLGISVPCGGSGGSCIGCGDDQCPSTIQQDDVSGTDGALIVLFGDNAYTATLLFSSASSVSQFAQLRNFFPRGLDYSTTPIEEIPYTVTVSGNTFAVTNINSAGTMTIQSIQNEQLEDGYLSYNVGTNIANTLVDPAVRFGTDSATFDSTSVGRYIEILEKRPDSVEENNGTWLIEGFYDEYNVRITREPLTDSWDAYGDDSGSNTVTDPNPHLIWRVVPAIPTAGFGKTFRLDINHEELIRRDIISLGCHPAVSASQEALENRYPDLDEGLPSFPDFDALLANINNLIGDVGPEDIDAYFVLDNYDAMATAAENLDIVSPLTAYSDELIDYAKILCPRVFDPETSTIETDKELQIIGKEIIVSITPLNRSGTVLSADLPSGVIDVSLSTDLGTVTAPVEILDSYGVATGVFQSTLISNTVGVATLTASVCSTDISDFNGAELITRDVTVDFVLPDVARKPDGEVSIEPLGKGSPK